VCVLHACEYVLELLLHLIDQSRIEPASSLWRDGMPRVCQCVHTHTHFLEGEMVMIIIVAVTHTHSPQVADTAQIALNGQ
jgi:hypothetical protein